MSRRWILSVLVTVMPFAQAASLKQAFSEGEFQGQIRIYNNTLAFQHAKDRYGTAFGGRMGFETKSEHLWGFSAGFGYYTANDLGTNKEASARAPFTPTVDVDILGEVFLRWKGLDTVLTGGRQIIDTPFANASDAFVIPITYDGYSLVNKGITGLTVNLHHVTGIKSREAQDFTDTGRFTLGRLGGTPRDTHGTSIFGLTYEIAKLKIQAWHYTFADIFNMEWFQAEYDFDLGGDFTPYIAAQYGIQQETGDKLLGNIDSQLNGLKVGVKGLGANLSFAVNKVAGDRYLTPYTFFTDPVFTSSMVSGFGNIATGTGYKGMLLYDFNPQLWGKLSYSWFDLDGGRDTSEIDADVRYKFKDDLENLSVWFRVGYREGDTPPTALPDLIEYRTQLQYTF